MDITIRQARRIIFDLDVETVELKEFNRELYDIDNQDQILDGELLIKFTELVGG